MPKPHRVTGQVKLDDDVVGAFDEQAIRRAAADEGIDVRSLKKRLAGEVVRGLAGARCDRAIKKLRAEERA